METRDQFVYVVDQIGAGRLGGRRNGPSNRVRFGKGHERTESPNCEAILHFRKIVTRRKISGGFRASERPRNKVSSQWMADTAGAT
jgi:hypothetical protein